MKEPNLTWDNLVLFTVLVFLTVLVGEAAVYFLDLNQLIYKDLSEQLTTQQIEELFDSRNRWAWAGYVALPVLLFLKITLIAWVLAIGGFFNDVTLSHGRYFRIVVLAEYVFLLPAIVKIVWFQTVANDYTYIQVQQFVPLSLQNIMDTVNFTSWALYPIQIVNVFEILYWLLLIFLVNRISKNKNGVKVVAMSYGPALFIWVVFIMFLALNLT